MKRMGSKRNNGVTLIELLIALVVSSILVAAIYRMFIGEQKIYAVQDEVADVQQGVLLSMDQMARKIRMAGYGGNILSRFGNVNGFTNIITPAPNANNVGTNDDEITILFADSASTLNQPAAKGSALITVNSASSIFNTDSGSLNPAKKYLCLNGENNYVISSVSGSTVTLASNLEEDHRAGEPVFLLKAITYKLRLTGSPTMPVLAADENTGGGSQVIAENIEKLEFLYTLSDGTVTDTPANPASIRMVQIDVTARTKMQDPQLPGDGYRRRKLSSRIEVRNLGY